MKRWCRTAGVFFLSTGAVYFGQGGQAIAENEAEAPQNGGVTLIDEADPDSDLFGSPVPVDQGKPLQEGDVKVTDAGTVEIHVNEANLVEVLRMLSLQSQKNIVASREVRGTVTANLYDVTVREALEAILTSNGFAYREEGNFIYVYTQREMEEMEKARRRTQTEVFRLHYTPSDNALALIAPVLSSEAKYSISAPSQSGVAVGGDSGGNSHAAQDVIIITDYPEHLEQARLVLAEVDRRPQQILIEATILRAALNEDNALGVDFTVLGGVRFNELEGAPAASRGAAMTGNIVDPVTDAGHTGYTAGGTNFPHPQEGLKVGIIYNNVAAFISALEQVTDTSVVANPKVLTLNRQKGQILVGQRQGYLTTTVTDTAAVQTVEWLETGTQLVFRPFIGDDGFVRMEIYPKDSTGGLTAANLPFEFTTEVTTNVMVRDGHTIVIGGLFREDSTSLRGQVPFLGNIPIAGALFRRQRDMTQREEVIILLTPHIIKDDLAYSQASEEELRQMERLRVGVRKGMMFFGRERLAESHYEKAVAEMNKPRPNRRRALWYLNGATNLNPKFLEAIELRESLTGREITGVDNSSVRHFVREQILRERELQPVLDDEMSLLPLPWELTEETGKAEQTAQDPAGLEPEIDLDALLAEEDHPAFQDAADEAPADIELAEVEPQVAEAEAGEAGTADDTTAQAPQDGEPIAVEIIEQDESADTFTVIEVLADEEPQTEQVILPLD